MIVLYKTKMLVLEFQRALELIIVKPKNRTHIYYSLETSFLMFRRSSLSSKQPQTDETPYARTQRLRSLCPRSSWYHERETA
ncbi:hypothetical protein Mapa_008187 [Marchantia paleacea]|nr:hypothetical protein Mapa_008187 [Marchantia paleacea]